MTTHLSRRAFLRSAAGAACTVAVSTIPAVAVAKPDETQVLATLIDIRKCVGCEACVEACRDTNSKKFPQPKTPFPKMYPARSKPEDWLSHQDATDRLTPYNWVMIQSVEVTYKGQTHDISLPRRCMHCSNPPCVKLCPWGAARQLKNGIARIDADICLGGSKCKKVCPWQIPQRQSGVGLYLDLMPSFAGNGVMYKCDRCYDRISKGQPPACIKACPEGVQTIGNRDEIIRKAYAIAQEIDGFIYGEKENGGTNTIYVSPVPFELIEEAGEKEHPHMRPVADMMATGNNVAKAMLIAPFAGAAAAFAKFYKYSQSHRREEKNDA